ncbi:MAG: leucyl aminopeptidase [Alphaproteobacteria bacterium]|nr:leucyl aminopeptidase [Alphaproteobacteria bacterium]
MLHLAFDLPTLPEEGALAVTVGSNGVLGAFGLKLDRKTGGALSRAIETSRFKGKKDQTLTLLAPPRLPLSRLILVGIGDPASATEDLFVHAGAATVSALNGAESHAMLVLDSMKNLGLTEAEAASQAALGTQLRAYRFGKYVTKKKDDQKPALKKLILACKEPAAAKTLYARLAPVAHGVTFARDAINEPANVLYPESFAERLTALAKLGIKVDVLDEKALKNLGMNALLGVAQGSARPPCLVSLQWLGDTAAKNKAPVCFVGKGVTFDSGGISLKPSSGMEEMKRDMAGAAAIAGAMAAVAGRKAKANVAAVVGLVENMPSGNAQRPGDIVTSASGQTIEIINTDAEGRLVLADALWYAQKTFKPRCIVDMATLTGAIVMALGHEFAGLFSNDDTLSDQLTRSGKRSGELLWRFPMTEAFDRVMDSSVADMRNTSSAKGAGSITAAQFLQRFIKEGTPWAHLDIAGTAWQEKGKPLCVGGATAFGVRLLDRFIADYAEHA